MRHLRFPHGGQQRPQDARQFGPSEDQKSQLRVLRFRHDGPKSLTFAHQDQTSAARENQKSLVPMRAVRVFDREAV